MEIYDTMSDEVLRRYVELNKQSQLLNGARLDSDSSLNFVFHLGFSFPVRVGFSAILFAHS